MSAVVAVVALLPGPLLASVQPEGRAWHRALDLLTRVLVAALCALSLIPHVVREGGWIALLLVAGAAVVPWLLHRFGRLEGSADGVALAALAAHTLLDGAALAVSDDPTAMTTAIAAHRVPVGFAVFSAAPSLRIGWSAVGVLAATTVAGFLLGDPLHALGGEFVEVVLEALVAGALLHVAFGHSHHDHDHDHDHD